MGPDWACFDHNATLLMERKHRSDRDELRQDSKSVTNANRLTAMSCHGLQANCSSLGLRSIDDKPYLRKYPRSYYDRQTVTYVANKSGILVKRRTPPPRQKPLR